MTRRPYLLPLFLGCVTLLALVGYLLASRGLYRLGFPLDDAWIHQTYARNLALSGEWAFQPGQKSAGSTAPLWTFLLSIGYITRSGPFWWTFLLGWALLFGLAWTGARVSQRLAPEHSGWALWVGLFLTLEWHLVWAAGSGMEILLLAAIAVLLLWHVLLPEVPWLWLGLLLGLSVWIRPDGLSLALPLGFAALLGPGTSSQRFGRLVRLFAGCLLGILPYLAFNTWLSGSPLPNTFFAKQVEYAVHRQSPLWRRFLDQVMQPLVGPGVLLLPGFGFVAWQALGKRQWAVLGFVGWVVGYLGIYALRLPVVYQHGRYAMPVMPVYFVLGLAGTFGLLRVAGNPLARVLTRSLVGALAVLTLAFYFTGMQVYARDVAIIESEMVDTARWLSENTGTGDLVAAHDIGALGYYARRPILDLAGLVTPEVIPFLRDEQRLARYLDQQRALYLVTFPGWYPELVMRGQELYRSQGQFSPQAGGENMAVYRWGDP